MFRPQSSGSGLEPLFHRPRPSSWQKFSSDPLVFLVRSIYERRQIVPVQTFTHAISVVCISDTHNTQPDLPLGDVLVHAGDLTQSGSFKELQATLDWLNRQPHPHKIVVAGNHDLLLDSTLDATAAVGGPAAAAVQRERINWGSINYLQNSATDITCQNGRQLRIYGSPHSSRHGNWAFQYPRSDSKKTWTETVPDDVDILITHSPPRAHLDMTHLGCPALLEEVWRVRPKLHIFGHVHEGNGSEWLSFDALQVAYERAIVEGGLWNTVRVIAAFVRTMFRPAAAARTLLVNACMVGGLRDNEARSAIVARI